MIKRTDKRQQRNRSRPFDFPRQLSLMPGTRPGNSPRNDFSAFCDKVPQRIRVFVVEFQSRVRAEPTDFSPGIIFLFMIKSHLKTPLFRFRPPVFLQFPVFLRLPRGPPLSGRLPLPELPLPELPLPGFPLPVLRGPPVFPSRFRQKAARM